MRREPAGPGFSPEACSRSDSRASAHSVSALNGASRPRFRRQAGGDQAYPASRPASSALAKIEAREVSKACEEESVYACMLIFVWCCYPCIRLPLTRRMRLRQAFSDCSLCLRWAARGLPQAKAAPFTWRTAVRVATGQRDVETDPWRRTFPRAPSIFVTSLSSNEERPKMPLPALLPRGYPPTTPCRHCPSPTTDADAKFDRLTETERRSVALYVISLRADKSERRHP